MPVLMLIAVVVVLVGIFFVATGRGGELAHEQADHAPLDLGPVSAADIALLRPPSAMWGYNMQVTDAALDQIARAMRERDVTIAYLQDQLANSQHGDPYREPRGAHARPAALPQPGLEPPESAPLEAAARPEAEVAYAAAPNQEILEEETPAAKTPEELAVPEPLEPLVAAGSRTAHTPVADTPVADTPVTEDSGADTPADGIPAAEAAPHAPEGAPWETPAPRALAADAPLAATPPSGIPRIVDAPALTPTSTYRQTPLVLKASGPKPPPAPEAQPAQPADEAQEDHEATQPSQIRVPTEPNAILQPTGPNAVLEPDRPEGPQGAFDTHDWWAEQTEAARAERARRQAAGEADEEEPLRPGDDPPAAEEQGW